MDQCCSKEVELLKIALVGNPNVGKSCLFNSLSGYYVEVSNFSGTTVDVSKAFIKEGELLDTPGVYSISDYTEEEKITKNLIKTSDIIINVVNASTLDKDLFLTQQLIDLGFSLIVVLNQMDEAEKCGIKIDVNKLEELMGLKIIPAVATSNKGNAEILKAINNKDSRSSDKKTNFINKQFYKEEICFCKNVERIITVEGKNTTDNEAKDTIYNQRRALINDLLAQVVSETNKNTRMSVKIGNLLLNPVWGSLFAAFLMYVLYQFLGVFIAGEVVEKASGLISDNYTPWIRGLIDSFVSNDFMHNMLVGEFGVLTMTIELIFGLLLPLIAAFYLFMAMLEDSGYLPRLAVITDRFLNKLGLNGRAVIPLILGFGCSCMGVITTRVLSSKKERLIATAIIGLTIPCSAQLSIIIALIAFAGGFSAWMLYLGIIFLIIVLSGTILNKLLKGKSSDLLIDLPPMRLPKIENTAKKTYYRIIDFIKEAVPLFFLGTFIISVLESTGMLKLIEKVFVPITVNVLHLPHEISNMFIMGMIRRDMALVSVLPFTQVTSDVVLTTSQIVTVAIVSTLFVPCIATMMVIIKEIGFKESIYVWIGSFAVSILVGGILAVCLPFIV